MRLLNSRYAPALLLGLGALLLLPGLGRFGLWDPQEIQKVDLAREALHKGLVLPAHAARPPLPVLLIAVGLRVLGTSEFAARLPVALCGLLILAALYGLGAWLYGRRPALLAGLALLTVPTFFLGARQATLHLPALLGHILAVFGLAALAWPRPGAALRDRALGLVCAGAGLAIGFFSLGSLLGVSAPLFAVGAALSLSLLGQRPALSHRLFLVLSAALGTAFLLPPVRQLLTQAQASHGQLVGAGAALCVAGVAGLLWGLLRGGPGALLVSPILLVLGLGFLPALPAHGTGYSAWLGGFLRWPSNREIQVDSVLRPIGFQFFPWCALLPLALASFFSGRSSVSVSVSDHVNDNVDVDVAVDVDVDVDAAADDPRPRFLLLLPVCWFSLTYLFNTYYNALVQEVPFPALGALALLCGVYLDGALADENPRPLSGLCAGFLCLLIGRDLFLYPEQYGSAHFTDVLRWPAPLAIASPVIFNASLVLGAALGLGLWLRGRPRRIAITAFLGLCVLAAAAGNFVLVPQLSHHVSYRGLFTRYKALGGGQLGLYAVPRSGSKFYDQNSVDLTSIPAVFEFLGKDPARRAFVMIGAQELAPLDQYARQHHLTYYVVDDSNVQFLLLSNRLGAGEHDLNPLLRLVLDKEPAVPIPLHATFAGKIELLGYDVPQEVHRGQDFTFRLYYKVLEPVGGDFKIFLHLEGGGARWLADHSPLDGKFPTLYWVPGTYIIDEHPMNASRGDRLPGYYQILTGFWPGGNGERLKVTAGPNDGQDRVKLGTVKVK